MITETVEARIARLTAERDRLAAQAEFAVNYSNMMSGERDAFCSLATQAERERDAALARAEKYAADLHEEQRLHTEAVARAEAAERDLAQLRTDMQHLSTEDERGHALIDAADGEDPDTSSADTLTDRVERLLEQRTAARAELAQARETIENLGRQVGGLPLLRDVIAERDQLAAERDDARAELAQARATIDAVKREADEARADLRRVAENRAELVQVVAATTAERDQLAAAYDELLALLASPPSATAATCARGCDGYDRAGLPCEYPDCAPASVATQSEANKELVREARRIGRSISGADPALAGVRIGASVATARGEAARRPDAHAPDCDIRRSVKDGESASCTCGESLGVARMRSAETPPAETPSAEPCPVCLGLTEADGYDVQGCPKCGGSGRRA